MLEKKLKKGLTNGGTCAIIKSQKVKDRPKNQKGFETMATENKTVKITKAMRFADIRAMINGDEVPMLNGVPRTSTDDALEFIDHEVELLSRKNTSKDGKQTEAQKKRTEYKAMIMDFMNAQPADYAATCTVIGNSIPELVKALGAQATTSMYSSLCNSLVADLLLVKKSVKNQSLFSLA